MVKFSVYLNRHVFVMIANVPVVNPTFTLNMLGKTIQLTKFRNIFLNVPLETRFDIPCKLFPGDNLHEISRPFSWRKSRKLF